MAELLDTVNKQLSTSIEFKRGMAAFFSASADNEQKALDACTAIAAERDEYRSKYEAEKERADKAEKEVEYWKNLAMELQKQPKVVVKGQATVKKLVTGNVTEFYGKDNSNQGQHYQRIGAGRETLPHV